MTGGTGDLKPLLAHVAQGRSLSEAQAEAAFDIIMSGNATPSQIGAFLMALRVRGETVDEIAGAARTMRAKAVLIDAPPGTIDTCGTGGDASGSFNISTASALVVAGCGVPVAKHGNRALSSKSGSADVLTALGVNIDADFAVVHRCLWEIGIGFLMAPRHHSATRHVAPDPGRARHPDDLQPARPAVEPGQGAAPTRRGVRARMGAADGRGAGAARLGARLGRAWRRVSTS